MKKIIISVSLLIISGWLLIYLLIPVKLVIITPTSNNELIGTDTKIELVFNKKLWLNKFELAIDPKTSDYKLAKSGNKITVTFSENLKANTTYAVRLNANRNLIYHNQKVKTVSWKFTTGADIFEVLNDMNFGDFFEKNPLARFTPFENDHFSIDWPDDQEKTPITLFATFNAGVNGPPIEEQEKIYKEQLKQYKQEALDWIKGQGVDPASLTIEWIPPEAANY